MNVIGYSLIHEVSESKPKLVYNYKHGSNLAQKIWKWGQLSYLTKFAKLYSKSSFHLSLGTSEISSNVLEPKIWTCISFVCTSSNMHISPCLRLLSSTKEHHPPEKEGLSDILTFSGQLSPFEFLRTIAVSNVGNHVREKGSLMGCAKCYPLVS